MVYSGGQALTGKHDAWLRRQGQPALTGPGTRAAFDCDHEAVLATTARKDRLDDRIAAMAADSQFTPMARRPRGQDTRARSRNEAIELRQRTGPPHAS